LKKALSKRYNPSAEMYACHAGPLAEQFRAFPLQNELLRFFPVQEVRQDMCKSLRVVEQTMQQAFANKKVLPAV